MPDRWKQVEQWRRRAEEIRTVADSFVVPSARDNMRNLARTYEGMADDLERRLRRQSIPKPEGG